VEVLNSGIKDSNLARSNVWVLSVLSSVMIWSGSSSTYFDNDLGSLSNIGERGSKLTF
jgi:hypothetical protein